MEFNQDDFSNNSIAILGRHKSLNKCFWKKEKTLKEIIIGMNIQNARLLFPCWTFSLAKYRGTTEEYRNHFINCFTDNDGIIEGVYFG
jgi:hypothetical protein